jgi:NTE family protein
MRSDPISVLLMLLLFQFMATQPALPDDLLAVPDNPQVQRGAVNRNASAISPAATITSESKQTFTETRPKLVLALSGGACKTVAEIGVLRSLEQHHIKIDGIVGTSMGATIGSLYCAGISVDDIEAMFLDGSMQSALLKGAALSIATRVFGPIKNVFKGKPYPGITDGKGYLALLKKKLPATFDQLQIPFAAVVTNLTDGQTAVLAHGDLPRAVFASNCVPTLYRPILIDGKLYVDGGLKANLPSNITKSMGADIVVAVLVDTAVTTVQNQKLKSKNTFIQRVMNIMMASSDKMQTRSADVLIYPDVDFVPGLTKDAAIIKQGVAAGQKAADSVALRLGADQLAVEKSQPLGKQADTGAPHELISR